MTRELPSDIDEVVAELRRTETYAARERRRRIGLAYVVSGIGILAVWAPVLLVVYGGLYAERWADSVEYPWGIILVFAAAALVATSVVLAFLWTRSRLLGLFKHLPVKWHEAFPLPRGLQWLVGLVGGLGVVLLWPLTFGWTTLAVCVVTLGLSFLSESVFARDRGHAVLGALLMLVGARLCFPPFSLETLLLLPVIVSSVALIIAGVLRMPRSHGGGAP